MGAPPPAAHGGGDARGRADELGPDSRWEDVQRQWGDAGRSMVHDSERFYAHDGVVFEVMRNGHLASVTLFSEAT